MNSDAPVIIDGLFNCLLAFSLRANSRAVGAELTLAPGFSRWVKIH